MPPAQLQHEERKVFFFIRVVKVGKYNKICWANRIVFVPLVLEDTGYIHTCHAVRAGDYEEAVPECVNSAVRSYEDYWYHRLL